jgi:hypothetical protein
MVSWKIQFFNKKKLHVIVGWSRHLVKADKLIIDINFWSPPQLFSHLFLRNMAPAYSIMIPQYLKISEHYVHI